MFQVDNNSAVATMPPLAAAGAPGWFTAGAPGVPPTYPGPEWFNIVQAELMGVLTAAGVTPDKTKLNQLAGAISALANSEFNMFGLGKIKSEASNANNLIDPGFYVLASAASNHPPFSGAYLFVSGNGSTGVVQIAVSVVEANKIAFRKMLNGSWTAWCELFHSENLKKASSATALAGTDDTAFMTALRVHEVINSKNPVSLSQTGWTQLPSGLILQWGMTSDDWATKTFPIAFPTACFVVSGTWVSDSSGGGGSSAYVVSNSQFRVRAGSGANVGENIFWFALGH